MTQSPLLHLAAARLMSRDFAVPEVLRGPLFEAAAALGSAEARQLDVSIDGLRGPRSLQEAVDLLYQLGRANRRRDGVYYTPAGLARWLVSQALEGLTEPSIRVADPCCGCGSFLVATVEQLASVGLSASGLVGLDLDPGAVEMARVQVYRRAVELGLGVAGLADRLLGQIRVGDALVDLDEVDVVVSNPPFGSAITKDTGRSAATQLRHRTLFPEVARGAYDQAFVFAAAAIEAVVEGGRVGLVLPRSVLSLSSASGIRAHFEARAPAQIVWAPSDAKLFADADVFVTLVVGERGGQRGPVRVSASSPGPAGGPREPPVEVPRWSGDTWSAALLPEYALASGVRDHGIALSPLGDLVSIHGGASTGAAYDLSPLVTESGAGPKLITTGLIDRYESRWGRARCRYLKSDYDTPRWPAAEDPTPRSVSRAAARQRGPKILVAGLTRVIEAVADLHGELAGVVSTWVVAPLSSESSAIWLLEALLNSPVLSLVYLTEFQGKELSGGNTTIGQRELKTLPIPADFDTLARARPERPGAYLEIFASDPHAPVERLKLASWVVGAVRRRRGGSVSQEDDDLASAAVSRLFGLSAHEHSELQRWFDARSRLVSRS